MAELYAAAERQKLRAKVARVEAKLTETYGARVWRVENYSSDLIGGLVATVLSQNTSDLNSGRAYASLKQAFPGSWDDVRTASVTAVANAIRSGGMANMKAPRIQAILQDIFDSTGQTSLEQIRGWDDAKIVAYLRSFHGVGAKTAACILMFNLGRPVLAVDTHVHRVSKRLGLIPPKATADQAHDLLQAILDDDQVYAFHVHFIEHGRHICHSQNPGCAICPLQDDCDFYQQQVWAKTAA
ncbi:MAG: endonuclease III domain-containing protein [Janthinobacterium lividum]